MEVSSLGQIRYSLLYSIDLIRFKNPSANCIDLAGLVNLGNSGLRHSLDGQG
jgi:hypothetical protein